MKFAYIHDICDILDTQRIPITSKNRKTGKYPYYGANGIQDYVDDYIFDDELVLLAEDGGNFGVKDKPIAYRVSGKCWVNNHAHVLKPKENILDVDYLCYSLMFYDVSKLINGTTRKKLNQSAMKKIKIQLPALNIQKKIANTLDEVNNLIDLQKQQLKKLDLLIKSKFIDMFGDPVTNSKKWEISSLEKHCVFKSGGTPSRKKKKYFLGTIPWITTVSLGKNKINNEDAIALITKDAISNSSTKIIEPNSLLFGVRVGVGKISINTVPMCTSQDIVAITNINKKNFNIVYLKKTLETFSQYFNEQKRGATIKGITINTLKSTFIPIPPIKLQNQFAEFIEEIEKQKLLITQSLEKLELLYKSLMQKYFEQKEK